MASRRGKVRSHYDVWPVIADAFLALLAVVVVMASGRLPVDNGVEQFKKEIYEKSHKEFSPVLADVEVRTKWARLVLTEETLSFPKCQWDLPTQKQQQIQALFRWIGDHRELLRQIRIEGHADRKWLGTGCGDVGPFLDNLQLSQNRARAVYNVLLGFTPEERVGLYELLNDSPGLPAAPKGLEYLRDLAKRGCLEVAGYGDRHPRDKSDLDSPKNRRVEVVLEFREPVGSSSPIPTIAEGAEPTCEVSQQ
jgi:outer membrane protein OmpA-like peptidoglycan-associated protein